MTNKRMRKQFKKWIDEKQYGLGWQDGRGTWEEFLSATWAGYQAGSLSRDAEVQELKEALKDAQFLIGKLAGWQGMDLSELDDAYDGMVAKIDAALNGVEHDD